MTVTPRSRLSRCTSSSISIWYLISRCAVGSSSRSSLGCCASAIATITRCRSPPLNSLKIRPARGMISAACIASCMMFASWLLLEPNKLIYGVRPKLTNCSTVKAKGTCNSCGTTAILRATPRLPQSCKLRPSSTTVPCCGRKTPLTRRSKVVFPDPFGPSSPTISPVRTSRCTS